MSISTHELAALAAAAYTDNRNPAHIVNTPYEWANVQWNTSWNAYTDIVNGRLNTVNDLEICAYRKDNEIVISIAGTNSLPDVLIDDIGLFLGYATPQITEALVYIKRLQQHFANEPGLNFTLTGHSLGGGLAALASGFLNIPAVCFDAAPFAAGLANTDIATNAIQWLATYGINDPYLNSYQWDPLRQYQVENIAIHGEFLSIITNAQRIGSSTQFKYADSDMSMMEKHSIALLAAIEAVPAFEHILTELPGAGTALLETIEYDGRPPNPPVIYKLLNHHISMPQVSLLNRYVGDMQKVLMANLDSIEARLVSAYVRTIYYDAEIESNLTSVVNFENGNLTFAPVYLSDETQIEAVRAAFAVGDEAVAVKIGQLADSNTTQWSSYIKTALSGTRLASTDLSQLSRPDASLAQEVKHYWEDLAVYLKQYSDGTVSLNSPAFHDNRSIMFSRNGTAVASLDTTHVYGSDIGDHLLGSTSSENLFGGDGVDVLSGEGGQDRLHGGLGDDWLGFLEAGLEFHSESNRQSAGNYYDGGKDNDTIAGSINADTYFYREGDGHDVVYSNDGDDVLQLVTEAEPIISRNGKDLIISLASGSITFKEWYADTGSTRTRVHRLEIGALDANGEFVANTTVTRDTLDAEGLTKRVADVGSNTLYGDLTHYRETLIGSDGTDHLHASGSYDGVQGGDILIGGKGNDFLYGSAGADLVRISVGDGKDVFYGGDGADIIEFHGGFNFLSPTAFIDRVIGDLRIMFSDTVTSLTIKNWEETGALMAFRNGSTGNLYSYGQLSAMVKRWFGDGNDNYYEVGTSTGQKVYGSGGNDTLVGSDDVDLLDGGADDDDLFGAGGKDQLWGQGGNDRLYGGAGDDFLYGNAGDDILWGGADNDMLAGGADNDELFGEGGNDQLWGGAGHDLLDGGADNDHLYGEAGNDILRGGSGSNIMVGGIGDDTFYATGSRDEMWGGGDFDTYLLSPGASTTRKLIFEDADGGRVDLSQYTQAGLDVHLQRTSADQLILTVDTGEVIVVNGWGHQTTTLDTGRHVWTHADVENALSERHGYTYNTVWKASQFATVVQSLSSEFANAVNHFGSGGIYSAFDAGLAALVDTNRTHKDATVYRWGWKAGVLSAQAISEGATYEGATISLTENNRTRSSALLLIPEAIEDPYPVERVDLWYEFWNDPAYGWSFAVTEAYSADSSTATQNPDGSITPSTEVNKVTNWSDPATWGLIHEARSDFQLIAG